MPLLRADSIPSPEIGGKWGASLKTPSLPPPHKISSVAGIDSAWEPRHQDQSTSRDLVSPEWAVAGPQRSLEGRTRRARRESPVGVKPLRLEDRFKALETNSESEASVESRNEVNCPMVGQCSENASNEALDTVGEFSVGFSANCASYEVGQRPVDEDFPPGTLVKWKDHQHPGYLEYDFAIVSHESCRERVVERDDRPWREGKITVYTGEAHVWASPEDLIVFPPGTPIPRKFTNLYASSAPSPEPQEPAHVDLWGWLGGNGLLEAESLELSVPQTCLPHLIGKRGSNIRRLEDKLGVVLGVMDRSDGCAMVSVVGPVARLELARRVVEIASKGASSLLDRLEWPPPPG